MGDLIPKNTDDEMERYNEADMIRRARIPMENNAALVYEVDPVSKREVALFPLSSGGYVKIGDRAVTPAQAAETDVLAAQAAVQNDGRTPIGMVMGGADGPTMEDYEAAGFTEAEVIQFQAQERAKLLSQPGVQVPVQLTPEQVQMGVDVGAPMLTTRDATKREGATEFLSGAGEGAASQFLREVYEAIGLDEFEARRLAEAVIGNPNSTRDFGFGLADLTPAGIIFGAEEGYNTFQRGLSTDDPLTAGLGALEAGLSVLEAAPMVGAGVRGLRELATPAMREAINTLRADAIGTGRAIMQGDTEMLGEVFQPSGTPTSLGAAAADDAALTRNTPEYLSEIGVAAPPSRGGFAGRISTRLPTAAKATEDPMTGELIIGYDELRADPKVFEPNVNIVRDYPNMRPMPDATTDETADQFIGHVKDNLLYLHDQVPEATRARSQLWYDGARAITDRWSQEYGVPDTGVAGALAALSPQKDWYQNVSLAQRVLDVVRPTSGTPTRFTPEIEETFRSIASLNKPKYEPLLDAIRGKSYDQITDPDPAVQNALRALFVRLHDQTYTSPDYRIVGPEGDFLDVATNLDGRSSRVAWGSLNEIGKAVGSIEANGDVSTISRLMGERHKVRNFYNNIYDPNSPYGDVTIDTHAVAAGLLRPLSGNSLEVDHNFKNTSVPGRGTTKGSAVSGVSGNYGLYAEAYRRAAEERGILPRQMQSITWEAARGLFPDTFKTEANGKMIDAIWSRYRNGEIEIDEARRMVNETAGGINPPTWQQ
jgi:hypothetical protein